MDSLSWEQDKDTEEVRDAVAEFKQRFYSVHNLKARDTEFIEKVKWVSI